MKKIIINTIILVSSFFLTWAMLTQIDWMTLFQVTRLTDKSEQKLGNLFWKQVEQSYDEIKDKKIVAPVDSIVERICNANDINFNDIKLHIVECGDVNAFAMPDNHLVVYSGLLQKVENENELAGVIGHEIAHMRLKHVMKKLTKEIGLSSLLSIVTGNSTGESMKKAMQLLSSTVVDRRFEKEADLRAVEYLTKANLDPVPFADFLRNMDDSSEIDLSWIETHPQNAERADYIEAKCRHREVENEPVLSVSTWEKMQKRLENYSE